MNQDVARRNHLGCLLSNGCCDISRTKISSDNEFSCATKVKGAGLPPKLTEKRNARIRTENSATRKINKLSEIPIRKRGSSTVKVAEIA